MPTASPQFRPRRRASSCWMMPSPRSPSDNHGSSSACWSSSTSISSRPVSALGNARDGSAARHHGGDPRCRSRHDRLSIRAGIDAPGDGQMSLPEAASVPERSSAHSSTGARDLFRYINASESADYARLWASLPARSSRSSRPRRSRRGFAQADYALEVELVGDRLKPCAAGAISPSRPRWATREHPGLLSSA